MTPVVLTRKLIEVCGGLNNERAVYFSDGTRIFVTPEEAEVLEQHRGVEFRILLDLAVSEPPWAGVGRVILLQDFPPEQERKDDNPLNSANWGLRITKGSEGTITYAGDERAPSILVKFDRFPWDLVFTAADWLTLIGPYAAVSDTDRAPAPDDWANCASAVHPVVEECPETPRTHGQPSADPDADVEPSLGDEPA